MSSGKNFKYQLPSMEKINLMALTEPEQETKIVLSDNLYYEHVTGEPYISIAIN